MGRAAIEAFDLHDRDPFPPQEVENVRVGVTDDVGHQLAGMNARHLGQTGKPPEGIEMEAGVLVEHAGEQAGTTIGLTAQWAGRRLWHRFMFVVTRDGRWSTVTGGSADPGEVGVGVTTAGPWPAM